MRSFWPPAEPSQVDYEHLRAAVLAGAPLASVAAARLARGGLARLIARPVAEPDFLAVLAGAVRPPWTPHADPRIDALATSYALVLQVADEEISDQEVAR